MQRPTRVLVIGSPVSAPSSRRFGSHPDGEWIEFMAVEDWLREPPSLERTDLVVVEVTELPPLKECRVLLSLAEMLPTARRVAVLSHNHTCILHELFVSGATHFVLGKLDEVLCRILQGNAPGVNGG